MINKPIKKDDIEDKIVNNSLDSSYSDEIQEHLSRVNMDAWDVIYGNYVNPPSKKKPN